MRARKPADPRRIRRGRIFLAILGAFLGLVAAYLALSSGDGGGYETLLLGVFGALLVIIAVFASDRTVSAMQALLTGWP